MWSAWIHRTGDNGELPSFERAEAQIVLTGTVRMLSRITWRLDWLAIFVAAFGVRLVAAFALDAFRHPQLYEYEDLARAMLAGRGFVYPHLGLVYHSFAPPLYSCICAVVYAAGGTVGAVLIVQMLASGCQAVVVALLAEQLFRTRAAGVVAGLLVAVHPGLVVYASAKAHPLTFDALFFTLVLWQFWRLNAQPSPAHALATGVVVGIGALTRSTVVVFLPIGALWSLWTHARARWPMLVGRWVVAALCAAAIILPWSVRNTAIHGQFAWMLTTDGEAFWRGNNPHGTGHSYVSPNSIVLDTLSLDEKRDLYSQPTETAQSRWFRARAWAFIEADPGAFVRLTLTKLYRFWWFGPQTGVLYPAGWLIAYKVFYVLVLALSALGAWAIARHRDGEVRGRLALLLLFLIALSGLQSLYYVEARHRWAIEPLLLVLAGGGVATVRDQWSQRRRAG